MNRGQQCDNEFCKHLKTDHKQHFKKGKVVKYSECLWADCTCHQYIPGKWLIAPQRYLRDD